MATVSWLRVRPDGPPGGFLARTRVFRIPVPPTAGRGAGRVGRDTTAAVSDAVARHPGEGFSGGQKRGGHRTRFWQPRRAAEEESRWESVTVTSTMCVLVAIAAGSAPGEPTGRWVAGCCAFRSRQSGPAPTAPSDGVSSSQQRSGDRGAVVIDRVEAPVDSRPGRGRCWPGHGPAQEGSSRRGPTRSTTFLPSGVAHASG